MLDWFLITCFCACFSQFTIFFLLIPDLFLLLSTSVSHLRLITLRIGQIFGVVNIPPLQTQAWVQTMRKAGLSLIVSLYFYSMVSALGKGLTAAISISLHTELVPQYRAYTNSLYIQ